MTLQNYLRLIDKCYEVIYKGTWHDGSYDNLVKECTKIWDKWSKQQREQYLPMIIQHETKIYSQRVQ